MNNELLMNLGEATFISAFAIFIFIIVKQGISRFYTITSRIQGAILICSSLFASVIIKGFVGALIISYLSINYDLNIKFSPDLWIENKEGRWRMQEDLLKENYLLKIDTNQVKAMLGVPDSKKNKLWKYSMGSKSSGLGWVFYYLEIEFDSSGLVDSVNCSKIAD